MATGMDKLEKYLVEQGIIENLHSRLLREVVYERLFDAIRNVYLCPGDALSEPRISKALGISRTPVREALHILTQEGLLETIPGRAVLIASPSTQKIFNTLQLRELLEPEMIKSVAVHIAEENRQKLQKATQQMEEAARTGNRPAWSKADNIWHELISRSCPNQLLGDMVFKIRNRVIIIAADENVTDQFLIDGTAEHREIVEAIIDRDGERAKRLVTKHLKHLRADILKRYIIVDKTDPVKE